MKHSISGGNWMQMGLALVCGMAFWLSGASVAGAQAAAAQKPAPAPAPPPPNANPFPEDTSDVPVMPSTPAALAAQGNGGDAAPAVAVDLPAGDLDPVRSPDGTGGGSDVDAAQGFSSSRSGLDSVLPDPNAPPDRKQGRRKGRETEAPAEHQETAAEDLSVGKYYLDNRNWRAAQSRYQSALVLAPENPDVYWGLAESARHLGDYAAARTNYLKVIEYDPDSKHAKEAAKTLKLPEMAGKSVNSRSN